MEWNGGATVLARKVTRFKLRVEVAPKGKREGISLRVVLPSSGPLTWPTADVVVTDERGKALLVRRPALQWNRMDFKVPARRGVYFVQRVPPKRPEPRRYPDDARDVKDVVTGLRVRICRWYGGKRCALSLRFDDSHPSHLSKVVPILREYGFKGTFMINPGRPWFQERKGQWEALAKEGDMEFANHTLNHQSAKNDEGMEAEIGVPAAYIQSLFTDRSKLTALNLGGGTVWQTTKPLRYYLDKYYLLDASTGSLGMDDSYGNRCEALQQQIERHLKSGGWCRVHYHYIGKGLSTTEENFHAELGLVKRYADQLWIAGLSEAYQYRWERWASRLELRGESGRRAILKIECGTDPKLFRQPLTVEAILPPSWPPLKVSVEAKDGSELELRRLTIEGRKIIRFDLKPVSAGYTMKCKR